VNKLPFPFIGIPIRNRNNPLLILLGEFNYKFVKRKPIRFEKFSKYVEEYSGSKCNPDIDIEGSLPFSTYYILLSKKIVDICLSFLNDKEKLEVLKDLDYIAFDSELIRALRTSQEYNKSILYRDGEAPIIVDYELGKINIIIQFPLLSYTEGDDAITHLAGILPIRYLETKDLEVIRLENGLWHSLYGLPSPNRKNWKWIWDLSYVSLIEF
jgi:hypothetical protein